MVYSDLASTNALLMSRVNSFLGIHEVQNFSKFSDSKLDSTAVVCACFFGVIEGVDMWCKVDDSQRFRLIITAGDLTGEAAFKLTDDVVKQWVPETCKTLSSMAGGGSLYPRELDSFFGDPFLFKVKKQGVAPKFSTDTYDVLDVCGDSHLVNFFIENYLSVCGDEGVVAGENVIDIKCPYKEYDHIDDFDELDFALIQDEKELDVLPAKGDVRGKKRKLAEVFEVGDGSSNVQKFKM